MSEKLVTLENFTESQIAFLDKLLKLEVDDIKWDLDQILARSEDPVKQAFDKEAGTNYYEQGRKIDQWRALAAWAIADGVLLEEEAHELEARLWIDPDILFQAPPSEMRIYSKLAHDRGKKQSVVTSRNKGRRGTTFEWLKLLYPWIPKDNISITSGAKGKAKKLASSGAGVFFEDTPSHVKEILTQTTEIPIILFPRALEIRQFTGEERVLEFPDMETFLNLVRQYHGHEFDLVVQSF